MLLFLLCLPAGAQIYSPAVLRKGQIDARTLRSLAESIYANAGAVSPRQKAEAIWRFFLTDGRFVKPGFWYHIAGWAYEEPQGEVLDPLKLLNSYGFGLCYHIAPLLEAVFEAGGFPDARVWFLTGHTVAEVFYDGAYHHYDSDMMGYTTAAKGDFRALPVASVAEIERDGNILLGKLKSPREADSSLVDYPWYPADLREEAIGGLAELFTTTSDNWLFPEKRYAEGHSMDFVLRPGEKLIRYFEPEGGRLYYLPYKSFEGKWEEFPQEIAQYKIRTEDGPRSQKDARRWATGHIEYRPPLPPSGLPASERTVFDVRSPYAIVDGEISLDAKLARPDDSIVVETSTDGGRTWDAAGALRGPADGSWKTSPLVKARSEHGVHTAVSGKYGYLVGVSFRGSGAALLRGLEISTRFQLNPRTLPALDSGANEIVYHPGAPRPRWTIPVALDRVGEFAARALHSRYVSEDGQGFLTSAGGKQAEYIFELSAPDGSALAGFDAGGRFLDIRDGLAPDKLTAEVRRTAYRAPRGAPKASLAWSDALDGEYRPLWEYSDKPAWRDGNPIGRLLRWPEVDRQVRSLPPGLTRAYVRYRLEGMALDDIRLAVLGAGRPHRGRLEITHEWRQGDRRRSHTERIPDAAAEHRYIVDAGSGGIENLSVTLACR
ncbi:MAG: hypothetical protein KIT09_13215 [Bryobacteraceae bacterium]|nr:hypothetical protein [Bryobacteraceae bacterium]